MIWSLGARYCARQHAHAFIWLWFLLLAFAGAALILRRRGRPFEAAVLLLLAVCTGALGSIVFYACSATAPFSMGLGAPNISATRLTALTCLGQSASTSAFLWTVVALCCSSALGSVAWGRLRGKTAAIRTLSYIGAALLLVIAGALGFAWFFGFSWCSSSRLF
jgi:hypothetical protein